METFTPVSALAGGALIGAAAIWLMALNGRILGVSGLFAGALTGGREPDGRLWRLAFLAGVVLAPIGLAVVTGAAPAVVMETPAWLAVAAGLLVGFGARYGSGCTSGHGVCGLSRLSMRSLAATGVFMAAGMAAATLLRPLLTGV
jgi:hypothetical protein